MSKHATATTALTPKEPHPCPSSRSRAPPGRDRRDRRGWRDRCAAGPPADRHQVPGEPPPADAHPKKPDQCHSCRRGRMASRPMVHRAGCNRSDGPLSRLWEGSRGPGRHRAPRRYQPSQVQAGGRTRATPLAVLGAIPNATPDQWRGSVARKQEAVRKRGSVGRFETPGPGHGRLPALTPQVTAGSRWRWRRRVASSPALAPRATMSPPAVGRARMAARPALVRLQRARRLEWFSGARIHEARAGVRRCGRDAGREPGEVRAVRRWITSRGGSLARCDADR